MGFQDPAFLYFVEHKQNTKFDETNQTDGGAGGEDVR